MRILLVEDDKDLQRLLKKALADAGYVVDAALDGEEGHFLGDTEPYDAVILDLGLPKLDGVRVLEKWRKAGKTMPVLILTARDRWSDKVAGFDAGADDYLAKPFYTEELLARLRALLRRAAGLATADIDIGPLQHRHPRQPRDAGRQSRSSSPAWNTGCWPISPIIAARWFRAPNWSSIFTIRISTATRTPSKSSSAACARSWTPI